LREISCAHPGCPNKHFDPDGTEYSDDDIWYCQEHMDRSYTLDLVDFIKTRISVTRTEGQDKNRLVLRELVQNGDDAKAEILVLRFEADALYVANNGAAFSMHKSNGELGDFEKISRVLKKFKADDKEMTGHFGSGFQTVYMITNRPEIHSNADSFALNPVSGKWEDAVPRRYSPYRPSVGHKGVLFRLPWRDDEEAERILEGKRPFSNQDDWPRWGPKEIWELYEDYAKYLRDVLACCQRLKKIRLVWNVGAKQEAMEASRDFGLLDRVAEPVKVFLRSGKLTTNVAWFSWDSGRTIPAKVPPSFDMESPPLIDLEEMSYLRGSAIVRDENGKEVHLVRNEHGDVAIVHSVSPTDKEIKKNIVHMLLPLGLAPEAFLYSVIPLPRRGFNRFVFSVHVFPTEDRKDVDIQGNRGVNLRWYHLTVSSAARLYRDLFAGLVAYVGKNELGPSAQAIVLQNLPALGIARWMRPEERDEIWANAETESLYDWLFAQPIIQQETGRWIAGSSAYLVEDQIEKPVVTILGLTAYPAEFVDLCSRVEWLRVRAEGRRLAPSTFIRLWMELETPNRGLRADARAGLRVGQKIVVSESQHELTLDHVTLEPLIRYAFSHDETKSLRVFPDIEGLLRDVKSFPKLPKGFEDAESLSPKSERPDRSFIDILDDVETTLDIRTAVEVPELPEFVSNAVASQPARFASLEPKDHELLSQVATRVVLHPSFANARAVGKNFLPFKRLGKISVGSPPDVKRASHAGENYEREWIFKVSRSDVAGLPKLVETRIKFLALASTPPEKVEAVEDKLNMVGLVEKTKEITNYIRHFISNLHPTLFDDSNLSAFIEVDDKIVLNESKVTMLEAVEKYFDGPKSERNLRPEDMREVPCLYDSGGNWHKPKDFALATGLIASLLNYSQLHPDFTDWRPETLKALGVEIDVGPDAISRKVVEKLEQPARNRADLGRILGAVLAGYSKAEIATLAQKLVGKAWIPAGSQGLREPKDTVFPSQQAIDVLGTRFPAYVDLDSMDRESRKAVDGMPQEELGPKLDALGIRSMPGIRELLQMTQSLSASGLEPPKMMMEVASKALAELGAKELALLQSNFQSLHFYWNGSWREGSKIRLLDSSNYDSEMFTGSDVLVLKAEDIKPFESFLRLAGARDGVQIDDLLAGLRHIADTTVRQGGRQTGVADWCAPIWAALKKRSDEIGEAQRQLYGQSAIFYLSGRWYNPKSVLIDDVTTQAGPVAFGFTSVVTPGEVSTEPLSKLGALTLSKLTPPEAYAWMHKTVSVEPLGEHAVESYLSVLLYGASRDWWIKTKPLSWPAKSGQSFRFVDPPKAYLGNPELQDIFRDAPFLVTRLHGEASEELRALAGAWSPIDPSSSAQYPEFGFPEASRIRSVEVKLWAALGPLSKILGAFTAELEWIRNLNVYVGPTPTTKYQLGDFAGRFSLPRLVPTAVNRLALILQSRASDLDGTSFNLLADWAVGEGFPPSRKEELANQLEYIYSKTPEAEEASDWQPQVSISGYKDTRDQLRAWYTTCQICGARTPSDENGATEETLKSVICKSRGFFSGPPLDKYDPNNSLYLCPRHALLAERKLVKFDFLEGFEQNEEEAKSRLNSALERIVDNQDLNLKIREFEWTPASPTQGWKDENIELKSEHAKLLFKRLLSYVESGV